MDAIKLKGTDIGKPVRAGSTSPAEGGYDIVAGGADIWNESDQFHFAYSEATGDFDMWAHISYFNMANDYSKAGIMARESLDPGSKHFYFLSFADNRPRNKNNGGLENHYRSVAGGSSSGIYPPDGAAEPPQFPVAFPGTWIRLKRSGDTFESLCKIAGGEWKPYSSYSISLSKTVLLGLAVVSHDGDKIVTARFRDIALRR